MRTGLLLVAILSAGLGAACGTATTASSSRTDEGVAVSGYVHAGPTCPVVQEPPASGCEDRPVAGAELVIVDVSGSEVATTRSAADGTFQLLLAAGSYTVVPQPVAGLLGTAPPLDLQVDDRPIAGLDIGFDTGIR